MIKPRYYQQESHDSAMAHVKKSTLPCVIELPTGAGKSVVVAMLADSLHQISKGKSVLCIVPSKELVEQNADKIRAIGHDVSLFSASAGETCLKNSLVVGTPVSIKNQIHRFGAKFCAVIIDECFTGETMVLTENGEKRIDEIKVGEVLCNAVGCGIVRSIFSKTSSTIILELSNGTKIECTGDHPIFTEKGFVEAKRLENGTRLYSREDLRILWGSFSTKTNDFKKRKDCCKHFGISLEQARMLFNFLLKEKEKSNVFTGKQGENAFKAKRKTPCSNDAWRERSIAKHSTACAMARIRERLGDGIVSCDKKRSLKRRLSKSLQNRYCKQGIDDCNRSRRWLALHNKKTGRGFEKTSSFRGIGVVSLSSIKRGSDRIVFNLRVSGHPSYFANGFLVHNCHKITPTVKAIVTAIHEQNPNVRVIGLSATPYRFGSGYIYGIGVDNETIEETKEPYFSKLVYRLDAKELIEQGFLSQPVIGAIGQHYDTSELVLNKTGNYDASTVDKAFVGKGRLTADIVADVVAQSIDRKGVMFFAATVQHAYEILESLPPEKSAIITGETPSSERELTLLRFKNQALKYIVNVAVLTTGFDAPHADVVAILRATESVSLFQQIIGRVMRICDGKTDCLILDYAENIERHCPDGDMFNPQIGVSKGGGEKVPIKATCPTCNFNNEFSRRTDIDAESKVDAYGYLLDLEGHRVMTASNEPMPAHYGRRCNGNILDRGVFTRCEYRWTSKECECGEFNDIAARYCSACKSELIDPNDKLKLDAAKIKDATILQTEECLDVQVTPTISKAGNECLKVKFVTPTRSFLVWFNKSTPKQLVEQGHFQMAHSVDIRTVTYKKDGDFYKVYGYNKEVIL